MQPTTDFTRLPPAAAQIAEAVAKAQAAARAVTTPGMLPVPSGLPATGAGGFGGGPVPGTVPNMANLMTDLEARKKAIAEQIASASNVLKQSNQLLAGMTIPGLNGGVDRKSVKAQDFTLRLDEQGRAVDQTGKVIKEEGPVHTLKANVAAKKVNPYLVTAGVGEEEEEGEEGVEQGMGVDPRIKTRTRHTKDKKTFQWHKEGTFVKQVCPRSTSHSHHGFFCAHSTLTADPLSPTGLGRGDAYQGE